MKVAAPTLRVLLENNVLEIKFQRRTPSRNGVTTRRMLCTNCPILLESDAGRQTLHYDRPTGSLQYNPTAKNLVVAWDILKQDYRTINADNCQLISQMPVSGDGRDFWQYFNESIYPMSPAQKESFFNV